MKKASGYENLTKEELIQLLVARDREILALREAVGSLKKEMEIVEDLKKEVEELKQPPVTKNSTNSSIPPSKDPLSAPVKKRSQRKKSGKKSGGQEGHEGHHRQWNPNPDKIVLVQDPECAACGASLEEIPGTVGLVAQEVDIPPIVPVTTEYRSLIKTCTCCGHTSEPSLPVAGSVTIGPSVSALCTYLNVVHSIPYERLCELTTDLLGFPLSEGTIANKLQKMATLVKGLVAKIKQKVINSPWVGSDETGTHVAGKKFWEWVWQTNEASYFVIHPNRAYKVIQEHFTETYQGVLTHDCFSAQNKTPAGAHQLCHAHLLRDLQYAIDKEKSTYAAQVQNLLRASQKEREELWAAEVSSIQRDQRIQYYLDQLDSFNKMAVTGKEETKLQKRFIKYKAWIFTFLHYPAVPPDNNSSERAVRAAKVKDKVSGGFRSLLGATRFADLLSVTHTLRKQHLPLLDSLTAIFRGVDISASLAL